MLKVLYFSNKQLIDLYYKFFYFHHYKKKKVEKKIKILWEQRASAQSCFVLVCERIQGYIISQCCVSFPLVLLYIKVALDYRATHSCRINFCYAHRSPTRALPLSQLATRAVTQKRR